MRHALLPLPPPLLLLPPQRRHQPPLTLDPPLQPHSLQGDMAMRLPIQTGESMPHKGNAGPQQMRGRSAALVAAAAAGAARRLELPRLLLRLVLRGVALLHSLRNRVRE